jgi:uncharacterized protein YndB with AHSA1/START domain
VTDGTESMVVNRVSEREVRIERVFDAPRKLVWRAMTRPDLLHRWWGRGHELTIERMELEPGGHWRYVERTPDGDYGFEGRYREVDEPRRISRTFEWDGRPGHVSVDTLELEQTADKRTRLVDTSLFMTREDCDEMIGSGMAEGVSESYAALDRVLASMK